VAGKNKAWILQRRGFWDGARRRWIRAFGITVIDTSSQEMSIRRGTGGVVSRGVIRLFIL